MAQIVAETISIAINLMIIFFDHKKWALRSRREKVFYAALFILLSFITSNLIADLIVYIEPSHHVIAYGFKCLSVVIFGAISSIFILYSYTTVNENVKLSSGGKYFLFLPILWNLICVIINNFSGLMFSFDETGYHRLDLIYLLFIHLIIALIYDIYLLIRYYKSLYRTTFVSLLIFPIFAVIYILAVIHIQAFEIEFPITEICFSLVVLAEYLFFDHDMLNLDSLTQCYGRKQCLDDLKKALGKSIVSIDIEMFRQFGFDVGDKILYEVSKYLKDTFHKPLYRIASDKFILVFDDDDLIQVLSTLNGRFENPIYVNGSPVNVKIRIAAIDKLEINDPEKILYILELMDSEIKKSSKNYLFYDSKIQERIEKNEETVMNIIRAVIQEDFFICYHGVYSFNDNKVVGAEILSRLTIDGNPINPADFLPILIDNQYIVRFDQIVIRKALEEARGLFTEKKIKTISINLTSYDLMDPQFTTRVKEMIALHNIKPNQIVFELPESLLTRGITNIKSIMDNLISFGIRFNLDDFGTGNSNLQTVLSLPFDVIKIDKSILFKSHENELNKSILKSMIQSIKNVGIKVLLEGVESKEDFIFAKENDCDFIQGYFIHKPLLKNEFIKDIEEKDLNKES